MVPVVQFSQHRCKFCSSRRSEESWQLKQCFQRSVLCACAWRRRSEESWQLKQCFQLSVLCACARRAVIRPGNILHSKRLLSLQPKSKLRAIASCWKHRKRDGCFLEQECYKGEEGRSRLAFASFSFLSFFWELPLRSQFYFPVSEFWSCPLLPCLRLSPKERKAKFDTLSLTTSFHFSTTRHSRAYWQHPFVPANTLHLFQIDWWVIIVFSAMLEPVVNFNSQHSPLHRCHGALFIILHTLLSSDAMCYE